MTVRAIGHVLLLIALCASLLLVGELYLYSRERVHRLVAAQDLPAIVHYAAAGGDLNVRMRGVRSKGRDGWTPLHRAIERNAPHIVEVLVRHGADVDRKDALGFSPLLMATRYRRVECVVLLLAGGADTEQSSAGGETPLMYAARHGDNEVIRHLLAAGADVNARTNDGWSALMAAAASAPDSVSLELLLSAGADPAAVTPRGDRAVDFARRRTDAARDSILKALEDH